MGEAAALGLGMGSATTIVMPLRDKSSRAMLQKRAGRNLQAKFIVRPRVALPTAAI